MGWARRESNPESLLCESSVLTIAGNAALRQQSIRLQAHVASFMKNNAKKRMCAQNLISAPGCHHQFLSANLLFINKINGKKKAYNAASFPSISALSVFSHVNSGSSRPKCP